MTQNLEFLSKFNILGSHLNIFFLGIPDRKYQRKNWANFNKILLAFLLIIDSIENILNTKL